MQFRAEGCELGCFEVGPVWAIWGFPKIRGTILGVPIIRIIVFWGLYWGPLILGNYHIHVYLGRVRCFCEHRHIGLCSEKRCCWGLQRLMLHNFILATQ